MSSPFPHPLALLRLPHSLPLTSFSSPQFKAADGAGEPDALAASAEPPAGPAYVQLRCARINDGRVTTDGQSRWSPLLPTPLPVVELRRRRQRLLDEIEELQAARTRPRTLKGRIGATLASTAPDDAEDTKADVPPAEVVQDLVRPWLPTCTRALGHPATPHLRAPSPSRARSPVFACSGDPTNGGRAKAAGLGRRPRRVPAGRTHGVSGP